MTDSGIEPVDFYQGADLSWMTEMESEGHRFYDVQGKEQDILTLMQSYRVNAVRLRVWVNPTEHGNWCNSEDVLAKSLRAKFHNMDIMIDFHYSDWWADPGKQIIPHAWQGHTYAQMLTDVTDHTHEVLNLLKEHGVTPKWVQVGNETSNGFLWPVGQADKNPQQYAGLFKAGYEAVKDVFPESQVLVHLDNGPDMALYNWNLDILKKYGAKWDMIGMSVYPYWSVKSGKFATADEVLEKSVENIVKLYRKYGSDVMVVETGMECADSVGMLMTLPKLQESKRQLQKLLDLCENHTENHCRGVFYWEPECRPRTYALGAFTEDGKPTVIMDAFRESGNHK